MKKCLHCSGLMRLDWDIGLICWVCARTHDTRPPNEADQRDAKSKGQPTTVLPRLNGAKTPQL